MRCILPTREIIAHYEHYESLFEFYEGGLRGVVKDLVLASEGMVEVINRRIHYEAWEASYVPSIVNTYTNSELAAIRRFLENTSAETYVEVAACDLENMVREMLGVIFQNCIINFSAQKWRWLGDDLIIEVIIIP